MQKNLMNLRKLTVTWDGEMRIHFPKPKQRFMWIKRTEVSTRRLQLYSKLSLCHECVFNCQTRTENSPKRKFTKGILFKKAWLGRQICRTSKTAETRKVL